MSASFACQLSLLHPRRGIGSNCKSPAETQPKLVQMVALELYANFNCFPVFLGADLKERYYKGERLWYRPALSSNPR